MPADGSVVAHWTSDDFGCSRFKGNSLTDYAILKLM
jgi:hypothetical protein